MADLTQIESREEQGGPRQADPERLRTAPAFVGKGVQFRGTLCYEGTIRVEGTVEGEIHTDECLLIGEGATVAATVEAGTVICKGRFKGNLFARDRIKLRAPAIVIGSLTASAISIEEGVRFDGEMSMIKDVGGDNVKQQTEFMAEQPDLAATPVA